MTAAVAVRARPGWQRWRCDLIDEQPGGTHPESSAHAAGRTPEDARGLGHPSVELRKSNDGEALLLAARAQARLDGHPGVVAVHQARLISGGRCEVRLGWAGTTLAGVIGRRRGSGQSPSGADGREAPSIADGRAVAPADLAPGQAPDTRLPVADLITIGATLAATLDDAHRLRPPLVHGALDATAIRLDRWGRARLDGFGARCTERTVPIPADDVYGLLLTLGDALGVVPPNGAPAAVDVRHRQGVGTSWTAEAEPHEPAVALISELLASVTRRQPDIIAAGDLGRALEAMAALGSAGSILSGEAPNPAEPAAVRASIGTHRQVMDCAGPVRHDQDATAVLGGVARSVPPGPLPNGLRPLRPLGQGGHGEVWLAHDPLLARNVVVKEFSAGSSAAMPCPTPMARELTALTQLAGHPASIECYGTVAGERPVLVLSWCSEGALDPERRWSPSELAQLGAQVADALAVLHGRGLVHGDIKPHNLLRDRWGLVRLADFSLTCPTGAPSAPECSPRHAPPEQLDGGPLSPGADLAALAATLFHLAEGRPPLDRGDGTEALVARRRAGALEAPPASLAGLPGLSDWVMAWLEPDPARRPSGGAAVAAATLRALYRPDQIASGSDPPSPRRHHQRPRSPRFRATMVATALAGIVALGALALGGPGPGPSRSDNPRPTIGDRASPATDSNSATDTNTDADTEARVTGLARRLPPADPLGADAPAGLTLDRRADGTLLLIRTGDPDPDLSWVLRRDDYPRRGGIIEDRPSASGLAGVGGTIDGPGPMLRPGTERSSVLADSAGASCVRVVTSRQPAEVSEPLCWD